MSQYLLRECTMTSPLCDSTSFVLCNTRQFLRASDVSFVLFRHQILHPGELLTQFAIPAWPIDKDLATGRSNNIPKEAPVFSVAGWRRVIDPSSAV